MRTFGLPDLRSPAARLARAACVAAAILAAHPGRPLLAAGPLPPAEEAGSASGAGTPAPEAACFHLDDIVVRDTAQDPFQTDASLSRIDRAAVDGSLSKSVTDALQADPSVFTYSNSRGETGFVFHGFDQRQVLVLMDGVPLYTAYDRVMDLGKIPLGPVDHITLAKGACSIAYGPNGLGGAINITTRQPGEGPLAEGEFATSPEDGAYRFRLGSDVRLAPFACHLEAGGEIEGGYRLSSQFAPTRNQEGGTRVNSDARSYHVSGKAAWAPSASHQLRAGGFFLRGDWGVPPNVYSVNPRFWRWQPWEDVNAYVGHAGRYGAFVMEETLYANYNTTVLDSYDNASCRTQDTDKAFHSMHNDSTFGVTLQPAGFRDEVPWIGGSGAVRAWIGARYDVHEDRSDIHQPRDRFSVYTLTLAPELELDPWENLALIAGFQADVEIPDQIDGFDPHTNTHVGPMFQIFCRPAEPVFLKLEATQRARFPTLKERYSSTLGGRIPNPDLAPETAWNFGLNAGAQGGRVRFVAGGFYSVVTGLIEETVPPGGGQTIDNVGGVRYLSAEALLECTLGWGFILRAGYAYLHYDRDDAHGDPLPYRPAHSGSAQLLYAWRDWLEASTALRAVSGQDAQNPDTGQWGRLGGYALWDAFLRIRPLRNLSFWVNVENLLDVNYQDAYGFPEPGRTFWIGVQGLAG